MAKKTRTELSTLAINTNLPDNTTELITPTTERAQLTDERESVVNYKDDLGGVSNAGKFITVATDGESLTMVDEPQGDIQGSGVDGQITYWDGTKTVTSDAMLLIDTTNKRLKIVIPAANTGGGISLNAVNAVGSSSLTFLNNGVTYAQLYYDNSTGNLRLASDGDVEINPSGTLSVDSGATFNGNITVGDSHFIGDDSFDNFLIQSSSGENLNLSSANDLIFYTGGTTPSALGTQRLRIFDSDGAATFSGNVGIGTTPNTGLELMGANNTAATLRITNSALSGGNQWNFTPQYNSASLDISNFATPRLTITSGGVINSYYGIAFPNQSAGSGTVSSSTLDAYEEGGWTPSITDSSDVAANLDSNNSVGVYTRVGNLVYFRATIQITSYPSPAPSSSSVAFIKGLPYTSATIPGNWYRPSSVITRYITFSGYLNLHVNANSNYGYLYDSVSASNGGAVEFSKYTSNSTLSISGVYEI